jgi:hypothetical protein
MAFTAADVTALEAARIKLLIGQMPGMVAMSDQSITFVPTKLSDINAMLILARAELGLTSVRTVAGNVRRTGR